MPKPKKIITSSLILAGVVNVVAPSLQTSAGLISFLKKAGSSISSGVSVVFRVVGITALVGYVREKFGSAEKSKDKTEVSDLDVKSDSTSEDSGSNGVEDNSEKNFYGVGPENNINEIVEKENNEEKTVVENKDFKGDKVKEEKNSSFNWEERCMKIFNNPKKFKWRLKNNGSRDVLFVNLYGKDTFYNISDIFLEGKRQLENKLKNMSKKEKAETVDIQERKVFGKRYDKLSTAEDLLNKKISILSFLGSAFSENPCSVIDIAVNNGNLDEYIYSFFEPLKNEVSRNLNKGKKENDMEYFQRITETGTFQEDKDFFKELSEKLDRLSSFSSAIIKKLRLKSITNLDGYSPEEFLSALVERAMLEEEKKLSDGDRLYGMDRLDSATRKEIFNYVKTNHPDFCRKLIKEDENNKKMYLKYINPDVNEEEIPVNQENIEKEEQEDDLEIDYHSLLLEGIEKCDWKMQKLDGKGCLFVKEGKNGDFKLASSYFLNCKRKLEKELKEKSKEELNKKVKEPDNGTGISFGKKTVEQKIKNDIDICNFMIFASVDNPWGVMDMQDYLLIYNDPFFEKFSHSNNKKIKDFFEKLVSGVVSAKKRILKAEARSLKLLDNETSVENKVILAYAYDEAHHTFFSDDDEKILYENFLQFLKYKGLYNKFTDEVEGLRKASDMALSDEIKRAKKKIHNSENTAGTA